MPPEVFLAVSEEAGMDKCLAAEQLDIARDDDNQYVCGSPLFPSGRKLDEAVYCNHSLTCSSLVDDNTSTVYCNKLTYLLESTSSQQLVITFMVRNTFRMPSNIMTHDRACNL
jgi:hypothetical protein